MSDAYSSAVARLSRVAGVRGALVVDAETAVPIAAELKDGVNGTALAALASALYLRTAEATATAQFGAIESVQLEADDGHVIIVGTHELILIVITERAAQLGMVRIETRRVAAALALT
jgi:predicted regulator of Ras-like GTPase activity (Roadblock/LC7/MglB family)